MKPRQTFVFYESWWRSIQSLSAENQGELLGVICDYAFDGIEPKDLAASSAMAFNFIRQQLDGDWKKYENICQLRSEAGKKGGASKGNQNARKQANQANACLAKQNEQVKAKQADNDNDNNNTILKEKRNKIINYFLSPKEKEDLILKFSLELLKEGRSDAYTEATRAVEYNEAAGWKVTTTKGNGDTITKSFVNNRLSYLKGWKRENQVSFQKSEGEIFAKVIMVKVPEPMVIDSFRGLNYENQEMRLTFLFKDSPACQSFMDNVLSDEDVREEIFSAIRPFYPNVSFITVNIKYHG